jgi:uncharacterized protein (DUF1499 family)
MVRSLSPCPQSPNCVSSEADPSDREHFIAPFPVPPGIAPEAVLDAFEAIVRRDPRTRIERREPGSLHATDRTRLLRFIDDIEARVADDGRLLHVRSASRVGYGDMGTNRRRIRRWMQALASELRVVWP